MIAIQRRPDVPPSLTAEQSYCNDDVKNALRVDFHGKCYLCEGPLKGDLEVDHRNGRDGDLEFDWWNLFPAHHDCNNRRKRIHPIEGYLEPGRHDDLESRLLQQYRPLSSVEVHFAPTDPNDARARNTAAELLRIHNASELKGRAILDEVSRHLDDVWEAGWAYLAALSGTDEAEMAAARERLRLLVSRRAPYTALVRGKIPKNERIRELLD